MTPEQIRQVQEMITMMLFQHELKIKEIIHTELSQLIRTDRYTFHKLIQILDGRNIQLGTSTGTKIGTAAGEKIGFHGKSPVAQQATIADADGTLADATTKINAILDVLDAYGLTA